jgi:hypothetical protein
MWQFTLQKINITMFKPQVISCYIHPKWNEDTSNAPKKEGFYANYSELSELARSGGLLRCPRFERCYGNAPFSDKFPISGVCLSLYLSSLSSLPLSITHTSSLFIF